MGLSIGRSMNICLPVLNIRVVMVSLLVLPSHNISLSSNQASLRTRQSLCRRLPCAYCTSYSIFQLASVHPTHFQTFVMCAPWCPLFRIHFESSFLLIAWHFSFFMVSPLVFLWVCQHGMAGLMNTSRQGLYLWGRQSSEDTPITSIQHISWIVLLLDFE